MIIEYKSVYSNQVTMADMIVLFVALVNVSKFFFLAVNPYFNQVVFRGVWLLEYYHWKKRRKEHAIIKSNYDRYNRLFMAAVNAGKFFFSRCNKSVL